MLLWYGMVALLAPAIFSIIEGVANKEGRKKLVCNMVITVVIANVAVLISYALCSQTFTVYEYLCVSLLTSILGRTFVLSCLAKKKIEVPQVLKMSALMAIVVAGYAALTYGQTFIHSDVATSNLLAQSIIEHKSLFPKSWNYANGEIWFLNNGLFAILPSLLLKNQTLIRVITSLVFLLIALIAIVYHSKKSFKSNSWMLTIPLICVFLFGSYNDILYEAAYVGQITWITLSVTFFYEIYYCAKKGKIKSKNAIKYSVLFAGLMAMLVVGGVRALAEQIVPLLGTCVFMLWFEYYEKIKKVWKPVLFKVIFLGTVLIVPTGIGFCVYKWLCSWHNMNVSAISQTVFVDSLQTAWNGICLTIINLFTCFGYKGSVQLMTVDGIRNFISIICCILICVVVPVLQAKKIKEEKESIQFFFVYAMIHNIIMLLLAVLFGKVTVARYLLTVVFTCIIISSRYIYEYWIKAIGFKRYIWSGAFVIATVIECIGLCMSCANWDQVVLQKKAFNQELVDRGLTKGYASYWNAYSNEVYSDLKIKYGAIGIEGEERLSAYTWLVDSERFVPEKDTKSFLMLTEEENAIVNQEKLVDILGLPYSTFNHQGMMIYCFNYDIASKLCNGVLDHQISPRELSVTELGGNVTNERVEITPGGTTFGPYFALKKGKYKLSFEGKGFQNADVAILSSDKQDKIVYHLQKLTKKRIELELELSADVSNLDIQVKNKSDNNSIFVQRIHVKELM